ncbi:MAG: tRNA adenosine(34) deaminase TadA [Bacillota bacterium]|nr:tRNA adenosine(34) deaminase TadA [Bacillota bacterium]
MKKDFLYYMDEAIAEARKAADHGDVPVGAVVVYQDEIVGRGYNTKENLQNPMGHAEINAIAEAASHLDRWRLSDCSLYVTMEPCPMCAGAILQARIGHVVFGAWDVKWGAAGSRTDVLKPGLFNHEVSLYGGIREEECRKLVEDFFAHRRKG